MTTDTCTRCGGVPAKVLNEPGRFTDAKRIQMAYELTLAGMTCECRDRPIICRHCGGEVDSLGLRGCVCGDGHGDVAHPEGISLEK